MNPFPSVIDQCLLEITQSRIDTGLIAIRKEFSSMFPDDESEIMLLLDDNDEPVRRKYTPHTSRTKESRIYRMARWYAANGVQAGTVVKIEILSARERLYRLSVQASPQRQTAATREIPWASCDISDPPRRIESTIQRIIRDSSKTKLLKRRYHHRCQVCGIQLSLSDGSYLVEVHHIRPLGGKHRGVDEFGNMLVLCPNHHALFDFGVPSFLSSRIIEIHSERIELLTHHEIDPASIEYHNSVIAKRPPRHTVTTPHS